MSEPTILRRKRLIHRSRYRGCREADLIFGRFADAHMNTMSVSDLDQYEALLEESDHDLVAWLTNREPVPERHRNGIFDLIKQFNVVASGPATSD